MDWKLVISANSHPGVVVHDYNPVLRRQKYKTMSLCFKEKEQKRETEIETQTLSPHLRTTASETM
jgi:hypothetical protein